MRWYRKVRCHLAKPWFKVPRQAMYAPDGSGGAIVLRLDTEQRVPAARDYEANPSPKVRSLRLIRWESILLRWAPGFACSSLAFGGAPVPHQLIANALDEEWRAWSQMDSPQASD